MASRSRRKFNLVIEKDFQYRYTLKICLIASFTFILFGCFLLYLIKMNYESLVESAAYLQELQDVRNLQREFRMMSLGIISIYILMVTVMFGLGLLLTQRLAGPLFAIKRQLKEFSMGKRGIRLSLRMGDEFVSLAEVFNEAMESWEKRQDEHESKVRRALSALRKDQKEEAAQELKKILS